MDAADRLSSGEQQALIAILHRRLAEEGRQRLAAEVQVARHEIAQGQCHPVTADELMREILQ